MESRDSGLKIDVTESWLTKRNRSQANAVQHVEAGACPRCPGKEAARRGVYDFIARNQVWWSYLFILRQDNPTQDSSLPWVWLALHFRRQGTCYLANRSLSTMGPELDMLSQTSLTSVTCVTRSSGTWAVWCNIRFGKKHWKQVIHATNFSGLCPPCCEPKIGPSLKEESSRPKQCMKSFNVNVTENWSCLESFWSSWNWVYKFIFTTKRWRLLSVWSA